MKRLAVYLLVAAVTFVAVDFIFSPVESAAKKIAVKVKVDKTGKTPAGANAQSGAGEAAHRWINAGDSACQAIVNLVSFSGYDKSLSANKETFLVVNDSPAALSGLRLTIGYFDLSGRQLHQREVVIERDLPSGSTRMVDIPSFDTQKSYYYYKSKVPRKSATPYKVTIRVDGVLMDRV